MYAFDALIGNEGRSQDRLLYDAKEWNLLLTGHDRAFGTKKEFPAHLQQRQSPEPSSASASPPWTKPVFRPRSVTWSASGRSRRCCSGGMLLAGAAATATGR